MELLGSLGDIGLSLAGTVLAFLVVLTLIVFIHEMGHFLAARWCGVGVSTFSVGFGPELLGFTDRKGTRWKISAIPLGGYVKFLGDENEASAADRAALAAMSPEERSRTFSGKGVGARAFIVAAGPAANFILAIVIFTVMLLVSGRAVVTPRIDFVEPGGPAAEAGLRPGDVVTAIDGRSVEGFADVERIVGLSPGRALTFTIERNGEVLEIAVVPDSEPAPEGFVGMVGAVGIEGPAMPPEVTQVQPGSPAAKAGIEVGDTIRSIDAKPVASFDDIRDIVGPRPGESLAVVLDRNGTEIRLNVTPEATGGADGPPVGRLGIVGSFADGDMEQVRFNLLEAAWNGVTETWFITERTVSYLVRVIVGEESADQLGGPIMVAKISGDAARMGLAVLLNVAAVLSISIGVLNLFPVPMLDGGHLLFFAIEAIRGRPLSERVQEIGFRIGFVAVIALMIFAFRNDIINLNWL
ncbi:MAG TPA: RIP metalloprotease RseP [Bauldia sp.]|nr:RIP metalloprotease RseP [Bauldia sp.]